MDFSLPKHIIKYFWGDDLSQLNWKQHQKYITKTLLEKGNQKAVSWLLKKAGKQKIINQLESLKLSQKSANFWQLYLS